MDQTTAAALQNAYQHIKAGKRQEAQALLLPLVRANPNLAEAWYLLGYALTDADKRLDCFRQVVRIDPGNQAAQREITRLLPPKQSAPFTEIPDLAANAQTGQVAAFVADADEPQPAQPVGASDEPKPAQPASASGEPQPAQPAGASDEPPQAVKRRRVPLLLWGVTGLLLAGVAGFSLWWLAGGGNLESGLPFMPAPPSTALPTATATRRPTPSPSPTPGFVPVFRGTACSFDVPLGTRVRCGTVRVPRERGKNLPGLIELPLAIYGSPNPQADAVIFLQGGPGAESLHESLGLFNNYISPLLQDHDVVFFDARGTGASKPTLDCAGLNLPFLDGYYQNRPEADVLHDFIEIWGQCQTRFATQGVSPADFNTTESAADVRDIAAALGYQKVNLLGISYGTRLGLTVMRDYPEIVRSAVLDSVVPMEAKMFNRRATDVQYALKNVFSGCAANAQCNAAYPDLESIFNGLVTQFDKKPVSIKVYDPGTGYVSNVQVNGVDLLTAITGGLNDSRLVPVVPKAIYDIKNGDFTFLTFALGVPGGELNGLNMGTYFATVCPEQVDTTSVQELDADLSSVSPLMKRFALAGLFGSSQNLFAVCQAWGAGVPDPRDSLPVKANIPTLITSGQYDPTTPVTAGQMVANDLPDSHFYVIPGMGHGATVGNRCSLEIMLDFLKDPVHTPNSACLAQDPFEFFIAYDGLAAVDMAAISDPVLRIQGEAPSAWKKEAASSTYYRNAYLFDPTMVDFESFPTGKNAALKTVQKSFQNSSFDVAPTKIGSRSANGLGWTLYESKYNGEPVILALAQVSSRRSLAVIMVVSAPERDAFYRKLFIPLLDAIVALK